MKNKNSTKYINTVNIFFILMNSLVVLDGKGHLLGRLASIVAKELLNGTNIVIVRCEQVIVSGSISRKKNQLISKYKKRTNTNPKRGPFHLKSPSQFLWKVVRGMLPHKTKRGTSALSRLRVYDGSPNTYFLMKKMVVPSALKILRLKEGRKSTKLGLVFSQIGWTQNQTVNEKENNNKIKGRKFNKLKLSRIGKDSKFKDRRIPPLIVA